MSIVKMKRLKLIALNEQRDDLLAGLLRVGCVEVTEPEGELSDPEWAALAHRDSASIMEVKSRANALSSALDALKKYAPVKSGLFELREGITEEEFFDEERLKKAEGVAEKINEEVREISQIFARENRLKGQAASLTPWKDLDWPLEQEGTTFVNTYFGVCPSGVDFGKLQNDLAAAVPEAELLLVHEDKEQKYLFLMAHKSAAEEALEALRPNSFSTVRFKDVKGTAAGNLSALDAQLKEMEEDRKRRADGIASYKEERQNLKICQDRMKQELSKQMARENFLTNGTVLFMEGWVAGTGVAKLEEELAKYCCAYELTDPGKDEKPPVLLKNPAWVEPMNMVVEMYSLPAYNGVDPDPLIWPFFVFFFGLMFADVGYGLIMLIACLVIRKKYKPKKTMGYICGLGILLGISTTICGALTGGFFGDAIPVIAENFFGKEIKMWSLVSPLENPMTILYFGIGLGIVHMFFGMCVKIYMGFRDGEAMEAILDVVPWWLFLGGIAVFALTGSALLIWIGVASLVLTQGRHKKGIIGKFFGGVLSLYDVTSWLGDILSYSRIMALMLATTVIASVVNILGSLPGNIIAFVLIFAFGHIFNLGINVIGTYVHAARLQYLEFFGKFYKDGGVPFKPLTYDTKYVDIVGDEAKTPASK
ncbi:MAG: V-type ATP synthase subunit I [Lachnospiraceae bacterium]|nr:V-type ATP synthase subunit I [Lachnospiraceae bacterium]